MDKTIFGINITDNTIIGEIQDSFPIITRAYIKRLFREATNYRFVPSDNIINRCCDACNILISEVMELDMDMTIEQVVPYLIQMLLEDNDLVYKEINDITCIKELLIDIFNESPLPNDWKYVIYKYINAVSNSIQEMIQTIVKNGSSNLEHIANYIGIYTGQINKLNLNMQNFITLHINELYSA